MKNGLLLLLACLLSVAPAECAESGDPAGAITPDEARLIWKVEDLVKAHGKREDAASGQGIADTLAAMYRAHRDTFGGVVVLNGLMEIDALNVLEREQDRDWLLEFALLARREPDMIERHLRTLRNPGRENFLESWLVFAGRASRLPPCAVEKNRQARVDAACAALRSSLAEEPPGRRTEKLFRLLAAWETPVEFEACVQLIVEEFGTAPELVLTALRESVASDLPASAPPPYERSHTNFHVHCLLAKAIGDESLTGIFEKLAGSDNEYVKKQAEATLGWLRQRVPYPVRYQELKRAFTSQS